VACVLLLLLVDVALDQSNRGGSSQQAGREGMARAQPHSGGRRSLWVSLIAFPRSL